MVYSVAKKHNRLIKGNDKVYVRRYITNTCMYKFLHWKTKAENLKTQIVTNLKNSNYDKTQIYKL